MKTTLSIVAALVAHLTEGHGLNVSSTPDQPSMNELAETTQYSVADANDEFNVSVSINTDDNQNGLYGGSLCQRTGSHKCRCFSTEFDLIIDGDLVKLGTKIFTPREVKQLKELHGDNTESTYSIFE